MPDPRGVRVRYFGDYELLEEIARGGMGVVYKARQISLNRTVAVKMILSAQLATEAEVRRFRTEAEAAANLQHPNIVAIHEVGTHEGQHYFSMDYVPGRNLAEFVDARPLHPTAAAAHVKTIAEAIHFAHQRGILHRDLKPQNVLIDPADRIHITDFGLAKRLDQHESLTQSGAILGSPSYMAPEQAAGRLDHVGPYTDVYSLGAILYYLLTGEPPFRAETAAATLVKVQEEDPVPPARKNRQVPPELETICLKCLAKEPGSRYASAQALAEDLGRLLAEQPILARPPSRARKALLWVQRRPSVIIGLVLSLALGLVWLAYALWVEYQALVWEKAHPAEMRPATWSTLYFAELGLSVFLIVFVGLQHVWSRPFERRRRRRILSGKRIHGGLLGAHGLLALALLGLAIYGGMQAIEFHSWDNQPALQLQRNADYQQWRELRKAHPDWPLTEPRRTGFPTIALVFCLACAFAGAWAAASLLRKVVQEYVFVMFRSAQEEQAEREAALWKRKHEDTRIFGVERSKSKTVRRTAAVGCGLGATIIAAFAIVDYFGSPWVMEFVIPVAAVLSASLTIALLMTTIRQNRFWSIVKFLVIGFALTGMGYLFRHYEAGLNWVGVICGTVCGLTLGAALRRTFPYSRRFL